MTKHLKVYFNESGYSPGEFIPCEVCNAEAVDIHHIDARGMGGTKREDHFKDLMALCRKCHVEYGDISYLKYHLRQIHYRRYPNSLGQFIEEY